MSGEQTVVKIWLSHELRQYFSPVYENLRINDNNILMFIDRNNITILDLLDGYIKQLPRSAPMDEIIASLPFCDQFHEPMIHFGKIVVIDVINNEVICRATTLSEFEECFSVEKS